MKKALGLVAFVIGVVNADVYLHTPAGSNNRNRERNENRANANRLFDSQNNDKGGYPWRGDRELQGQADPMNYYEGSSLRMEWTNQHACGGDDSTYCVLTLQYSCENDLPGIRDGYPTGALNDADANNNDYDPPYMKASFQNNNNDGTTRITANTADDVEYGRHETLDYSNIADNTIRNKGLYLSDRKINGKQNAHKTRQNPNGNRHGFEVAEERDYYPYWNPSPWNDIAVLTTDTDWCEYYKAESENVKARSYCAITDANRANAQDNLIPIDDQSCTGAGGTWTKAADKGLAAPECLEAAHSRQNHLGNVISTADDSEAGPQNQFYDWKIPDLKAASAGTETEDTQCIFRLRYNISTDDYGFTGWGSMGGIGTNSEVFDSRYNCPTISEAAGYPANPDVNTADGTADPTANCQAKLDDGNFRPRYNRPYVDVFGEGAASTVSIALNTDQSGRTFQDRSHVFAIKKRPSGVSGKIWNLGSRGRRGNIVQAYPAVEYDFTPQDLKVNQGDYVHFQWTGSDFNEQRNPNNGEGWKYSDRHNIMEVDNLNQQFPLLPKGMTFFSQAQAKEFAMQNQQSLLENDQAANNGQCETFKSGQDNEQNDPRNCGKLNSAPAHFNVEPMKVEAGAGTYTFVNTRDNNFSNRAGKFQIRVNGNSMFAKAAKAVGISVAAITGVILLGVFAFFCWATYMGRMMFFNSVMGDVFSTLTCGYCCCENACRKDGAPKDFGYKAQQDGPL